LAAKFLGQRPPQSIGDKAALNPEDGSVAKTIAEDGRTGINWIRSPLWGGIEKSGNEDRLSSDIAFRRSFESAPSGSSPSLRNLPMFFGRLWCKDQKPGIFGARVTFGEADWHVERGRTFQRPPFRP
jgi:hypothetical protein